MSGLDFTLLGMGDGDMERVWLACFSGIRVKIFFCTLCLVAVNLHVCGRNWQYVGLWRKKKRQQQQNDVFQK